MAFLTKEDFQSLDNSTVLFLVDNMERDIRRMGLENYIFEYFLESNEPSLLQGISAILDAVRKHLLVQLGYVSHAAVQEIMSMTSKSSEFTGAPMNLDKLTTRINISMRTDLVLRSVEEMQNKLEDFITRTHRKKCNLRAELEEISIRMSEIEDAQNMFEQVVIIEGTDPITQRTSAEKFIKYMNDWLKSAQFTIDKMRLRFTTSRIKLSKLSNLLLQKEELGENVHEVDFEKITIENQHLQKKIEQKNENLIELKVMCGNANLLLATYKSFLSTQLSELKEFKTKIDNCIKRSAELDKEAYMAEEQIDIEQQNLNNLLELVDNYRVPGVMEYLELLNDIHELKKQLKVWHRKMNIQVITLSTTKNKLVTAVGRRNAKGICNKVKYKEDIVIEDYLGTNVDDDDEEYEDFKIGEFPTSYA